MQDGGTETPPMAPPRRVRHCTSLDADCPGTTLLPALLPTFIPSEVVGKCGPAIITRVAAPLLSPATDLEDVAIEIPCDGDVPRSRSPSPCLVSVGLASSALLAVSPPPPPAEHCFAGPRGLARRKFTAPKTNSQFTKFRRKQSIAVVFPSFHIKKYIFHAAYKDNDNDALNCTFHSIRSV